MPGIFDNFLQQIAQGDQVRDFRHASKLFVDSNYRLSPKSNWMYHVFFDLNPAITTINDPGKLVEHGMLVKYADLPRFEVETKTLNEYNRPNIVQTKVKYETVTISFHDDMANVIRGFWFDYYTHYYRDTDNGYASTSGQINPVYHAPSLYVDSQRDAFNKFGYSPRKFDGSNQQQYINAIRIYSLHQKRFSEYTLINPVIVSFNHGNHNSQGNDGMECSMTVAYETVLYSGGRVSPNTVRGFADLHYDKSPSPLTPIGGGTQSILGVGGIVDSVGDVFFDVTKGNFASAAFTAVRAFNTNKNVNLSNLARAELIQGTKDVLNSNNLSNRVFIPTVGALATAGVVSSLQSTSKPASAAVNSASSNGTSVNTATTPQAANGLPGRTSPTVPAIETVTGGAFINNNTTQSVVNNVRGVVADTNNRLAGGALNQIYNISANGDLTSSTQQTKPNIIESTLTREQENLKAQFAPRAALAIPFVTGSGQIAQTLPAQSQSAVLGRTPYANSIIPASAAAAASEARDFLDNGNLVQLKRTNRPIGISTPPAIDT